MKKKKHRIPKTSRRLSAMSVALGAAMSVAVPDAGAEIVFDGDWGFMSSTTSMIWNSGLVLNILSSGTIMGSATALTTRAVGTVYNQGTIKGTTTGLYAQTNLGGLSNWGSISGTTAVDAGPAGINIIINKAGGTITGSITGIKNTSTIQTLTNDALGLISGDTAAIDNSGIINTLTNAGTINNSSIAISNTGTIGTLSNSGTISGIITAVSNGNSISSLVNSGIINNSNVAITNTGTIGTLSNSATISANSTAVSNGNSISSLVNSGTINSSNVAITNTGTIGTLTNNRAINSNFAVDNKSTISSLANSGTIVSNRVAITNTGTIGTISNSGTINASFIAVDNRSTISSLVNSGMINGKTAITNADTIDTLNNLSGATIGSVNVAITNTGTISALINSGLIWNSTSSVISNTGTISALTNSTGGTIKGTLNAVDNGSTINSLTNSGVIIGSTAIANTGTLDTLTNSTGGTINGSVNGVSNGSSITSLTNSGVIIGSTAITNTGTLGTLTNSTGGTINGSVNGVSNGSSITSLTNSGVITGSTAIANTGTLGTLTNSTDGTINGSTVAIDSSGTLGAISNAGIIAGVISNSSSNNLTINGGNGTSFGTLTGYSAGAGTVIGNISNAGSNLIFGTGNLLLNNNINVGSHTVSNVASNLQVNNQLSISGNYTQQAAAKLTIGVSDATSATLTGITSETGYGRLIVSGSATFAAGSSVSLVKLSSYAFASGQRFVVVVANSSGTNYNADTLSYSAAGYTGIVSGTSVTDGSNLDLVVTLSSSSSASPVLSNLATTGNARAAISALYNYTGTNASLLSIYNPLLALGSSSAANRAGAQLSPTSAKDSAITANNAVSSSVYKITSDHMDSWRSAQINGDSGVATGESSSSNGVWGQVFGSRLTQNQRDGVSGYHGDFSGLLFGADTSVGDNWRAGALLSYTSSLISSDDDNTGSNLHINSFGSTAYAGFTNPGATPWYINLMGGIASQKYKSARLISFTGFSGIANGNFSGMQYSAAVQAGYPLSMGDAIFTPMVGLTYSRLRQNAYTETGGNGAALNVGATSSSSLKSELGAKLERNFTSSYGEIRPFAQLSWRHELKNTNIQTNASFAADTSGATAFTSQGAKPVRNTGALTLGMSVLRGKNLDLSGAYGLEAGAGYVSHGLNLRLRYQY